MPDSRVSGIVRGTRSGFAFLIRDDGGEDLLIPVDGLGGAIHGDRVIADVARSAFDYRDEAIVEQIVERTRPHFTGDVIRERGGAWVRPDSPLLPERLPLQLGTERAVGGAKALFRVENLARKNNSPIAVLIEYIGEAGDARLDNIVIAAEFGLATRFSDAAMDEAARAVAEPSADEDSRREDLREQLVVTIDPIDAKDFDDAIALERQRDGGFLLTVHIADVTAYVPEGGTLDQEAGARGTSTYFPGAVFPMLPEEISNGAASLSPNADKRTLAIQIHLSEDGEATRTRVTRAWMRSRARLHYDQVQAILDQEQSATAEVAEDVVRLLFRMHEVAAHLRRRRFLQGGFELDVPEAEMILGADGVPTRINRRHHSPSHWIIEEFMIAANRAVGGWAKEVGSPFLFRVHEPPEKTATEEFITTVRTLRPGTPLQPLTTPGGLRKFIAALREDPLGRVLHRFFLRSMKKAIYDPEDLGHYGLGIDGYCHFTSPIRRYPDLFNHRRVKELLDGNVPERAHWMAEASEDPVDRDADRAIGDRIDRDVDATEDDRSTGETRWEPKRRKDRGAKSQQRGRSGRPVQDPNQPPPSEAAIVALRSTRAESNSEEAEREMIRLKGARYLELKLGRDARGHVTAVTRRGLFVELDRVPVEGFVPSQTLPHRVVYQEDRLAWVDPRSGWELRPGDSVQIQIVAVDLRLRRSEFRLIEVPRGGTRAGSRRERTGDSKGRGRKGGPGRSRTVARSDRAESRRGGSGRGRSGKAGESIESPRTRAPGVPGSTRRGGAGGQRDGGGAGRRGGSGAGRVGDGGPRGGAGGGGAGGRGGARRAGPGSGRKKGPGKPR